MKKAIIFIFFIAHINSFSQVGTVEIWERRSSNEVLEIKYQSDSTIIIQMTGIDNNYDNSTPVMVIFSGTPKEYYTFICELEKFAEENEPEAGVSINALIGGMSVSIEKFLGGVHLCIYEKGGPGFHNLLPAWLPKFKEKFIKWADDNNVVLR